MINFSGYGGKENEYLQFCKDNLNLNLKRISKKKYDFIDENGNKIELKKQKDLQWFNGFSYLDLSEDDKNIKFHFLLINKDGSVNSIYECLLGKLIPTIYSEDELDWLRRVPESQSNHQLKSSISMKKHIQNHSEIFTKIF